MDPDWDALLAKAEQLVEVGHADDVDLAGRPYNEHVRAVAAQLDTGELKVIGLLHDLIEDHPERYTFEFLREEGFGDAVVTALQHLTKRKDDNYWDYLRGVADNELAVEVKLIDLASNSDRSRIAQPSRADEARWVRYARAISYLQAVRAFRTTTPAREPRSEKHAYLLHRLLYGLVRSDYQELAGTLEEVLRRAAQPVCASAIIQARAKDLDSFTEKCVRKSHLYRGGVFANMTDLSAARVVLQTTSQVTRFCRFIEDAFDVDWSNSEDAGVRLGASEFGYRSHHYVVSLKPGVSSILGVPVDVERLRGIKAEIQVRTLSQHAVADTLHDRMYKSTVRPLPRHTREQARIASILENSDRILDAFVAEYDEFALQQSMFLTTSELEGELAVLDAVGGAADDPYATVPLSLKRAGLLRALGRTEEVAALLAPLVAQLSGREPLQLDAESTARLRFEYGLSRLVSDAADPKAVELLEAAFGAYAWVADEGREAWLGDRRLLLHMLVTAGAAGGRADWLHRALRVDIDDPYAVAALLGLQAVDDSIVRRAVAPALEHAEANVNEPDVHFVLGRLRLSLGEEDAATRHYAAGLLFYRGRNTSGNERLRRLLAAEIDYLGAHEAGVARGLHDLLQLGATRIGQPAPTSAGPTWALEEIPLLTECANGREIRMLPDRSLEAIAAAFAEAPGALFLDSPAELVALAALAVGSEVFVADCALARRLASEDRVRAAAGLRTIPLERETLMSLFADNDPGLAEDVIEEVATANHERNAGRRIQEMREASYRNDRDESIPTRSDIGERTAVWGRLLETYRHATRERVRFAPFMLATVGYELTTEREGALGWSDLPAEVREHLARLEHGRWNAERVRAGWVQHPPRDNARLMHDLIVAWDDLAPAVRAHDFEGISDLIDDLAASGLYLRPTCI